MSIRYRIAPALLVIAAALPAADELKISPTIYLQTRADIVSGSNPTGGDYVPGTEAGQTEADTVDFYLRRARIGVKASYGALAAKITYQGDNYGRDGAAKPAGIYDAFAAYAIKGDSVSHEVRGGLYQAYFNPSTLNSGWALFPASAGTENLAGNRSVGVGYTLDSSAVDLYVDVMNTRLDGTSDQNAAQSTTADGDGLWISGRLALTLPGEWQLEKFQDSFGGAPGKGLGLGLEFVSEDEQGVATAPTVLPVTGEHKTTGYGIDLTFRLDGLVALAEYRAQKQESSANEVKSAVWRLQAGYAFVLSNGTALEPAIRYQAIDLDTDNDNETGVFGGSDFASASGNEIDVGVNWYLAKNNHKLSALLTKWDAEEGDGDATIFRVQHQIIF